MKVYGTSQLNVWTVHCARRGEEGRGGLAEGSAGGGGKGEADKGAVRETIYSEKRRWGSGGIAEQDTSKGKTEDWGGVGRGGV